MGRWKGGGHGCALPSSSSSQSLAGRRGQSFSLNPPCSCLSLASFLPEENLLFSFPSQFLGDIWMRAAVEKSLCPRQPLPTFPPPPSPLNMTFSSFQPSTCSPSTGRTGPAGEGTPKRKAPAKRKDGICFWPHICRLGEVLRTGGDSGDTKGGGRDTRGVVGVPPLTGFQQDDLVILTELHEAINALGELHHVLDGIGDLQRALLPHGLAAL